MSQPNRTARLVFLLAVCYFGLFVTFSSALSQTNQSTNQPWRTPLVSSVFIAICVSGIVAALSPDTCLGKSSHSRSEEGVCARESSEKHRSIQGHHFDCGRFNNHLVRARDRTLCGACLGLAIGASLAVSATLIYVFTDLVSAQNGFFSLLAGSIFLVAGSLAFITKGYVRVLINSLFVVGGFFLIAGADSMKNEVSLDFYVLGLLIVWILLRTEISRWDHGRICARCVKEYEVKKGLLLAPSPQTVKAAYDYQYAEDH